MIPFLVVLLVVFLVLRWRWVAWRRRQSEEAARQLARRPLTEFDCRFPADRRMDYRGRRRKRARLEDWSL